MSEKTIMITLGVMLVIIVKLVFTWLFWLLWCWAIPQIFPGASEAVRQPSFLLFLALTIIVSAVGGMLKGVKSA